MLKPISLILCAGSLCLTGCTPDLQRIKTPDLLRLPEQTAATPRTPRPAAVQLVSLSPTDPRWSVAHQDWKIYTTLQPSPSLTDGEPATSAVAALPESKDQYVLVDLGKLETVTAIRQLHGPAGGPPGRYRIDVAGTHNFPYTLAYQGTGTAEVSTAAFTKPTACRFFRITLLEPPPQPWAIAELQVDTQASDRSHAR